MGFQEDAMKRRGSIGKINPKFRIGIAVVAVLVAGIVAFEIASSSASGFEIVTQGSEDPEISTAQAQQDSSSSASATQGGESAAATQQEETESVFVYVTGCVANPGVVELSEGCRVKDAIDAAGGMTGNAAADQINLARVLVDGEQIDVLSTDEVAAGATGITNPNNSTQATSTSSTTGGLVNINTAGADELQTLDGVGEATANKIIAYREENGPFKSIEDIKEVSGIGDKKFEALKDSICV